MAINAFHTTRKQLETGELRIKSISKSVLVDNIVQSNRYVQKLSCTTTQLRLYKLSIRFGNKLLRLCLELQVLVSLSANQWYHYLKSCRLPYYKYLVCGFLLSLPSFGDRPNVWPSSPSRTLIACRGES